LWFAGKRDAAINVAEGEKRATILASEASMQEQMNRARGEAEAIDLKAQARARAIRQVSGALQAEVITLVRERLRSTCGLHCEGRQGRGRLGRR
jgi:regulator of protease activity HflC (stomatin/prohibitin superfamily)